MDAYFLPALLLCVALLTSVQAQVPKNVEEHGKAATVPLQVGGDVSAPRAIYSPEPEFSKAARKAGYQGTCVLSLIVGADGKPRDISVVRKLGMQLDEKAVEAVSNWTFEPARKNGQPVAVQIEVEVSFHLYRHGPNLPSAEPAGPMLDALSRVRGQIYRVSESPEPIICAHDARSGSLATIAELSLEGDFRMPSTDRDQITAALKQRTYSGELEGAESEISERVRAAWQSSGYFKVQVHTDARVLTSGPDRERIAVTVQVDEGQQYRLEEIRFRNNQAITNVEALRQLFPLKDGDLFDRTAIGKGLENLRRAYGQYGYANSTAVPDTRFHEERQTISLDINLDEGKQFYVSRIDVIGLDESAFQNVLKEMTVKPGDVYDRRLVDLFLQRSASLLPPDVEPRFDLKLNESQGTVAIRYDFRRCHVD
jgi:TonB family protein